MKYQHRMIILVLAIGFLVGIIPSTAQATPILTLSDGATMVRIEDNLTGDWGPSEGVVSWIGAVGDWGISVTTGITKPAIGSAAYPILEIVSFNVRFFGTSTTTLNIVFSEDGFSTGDGSKYFSSNIGGNLWGSTLTYNAYVDGTPLTKPMMKPFSGSSSGSSFSGDEEQFFDPPNDPFSLSMHIAITSDGPFQGAGFSARLVDPPTSIPEPATMLVLGTGLFGLTAFAIRRIYKK